MRLISTVVLVFSSFSLFAVDNIELQNIQQRIQPEGQVHVQEPADTSNQAKDGNKVTEAKKVPGQTVYEQHCIVCHRDGLAGAPKLQDEKDWKPRMTGKTMKDLLASSIKGLNAMPAKGTCIECSDADLKAAIQYMLPKS